MKRTTKRAHIAHDFAALPTLKLVAFTRVICGGIPNNSHLTAADIAGLPETVATMLAAALELETTHNGRATAPSTTSTTLEGDQATALVDHLTDTAGYFEALANSKAAGNVATADQIILSIGFHLKHNVGKHAPHAFDAASRETGTLTIDMPTAAADEVNLARYSINGGTTYSLQFIVHHASITLTGMKSATPCLVQHATDTAPPKGTEETMVAGTEELDWSDPVSCTIM